MLKNALRWISYGFAVFALATSAVLLLTDAGVGARLKLQAATISGASLLLAGAAFLILQPVIRPRLVELVKNALLAATFLLWGAIQFLPQNAASLRLGNVVIALYVLDLAWVILSSKISRSGN